MKTLLFVITLGILACSNNNQNSEKEDLITASSPTEFAKLITSCICKKDFDCLETYFANKTDVTYLFSNTNMPDKEKENVLNSLDERMSIVKNELKSDLSNSFLNEYEFDSCKFEIIKDPSGIENISGFTIKISNGSKSKLLIFDKIVKVKRGWVLMTSFKEIEF